MFVLNVTRIVWDNFIFKIMASCLIGVTIDKSIFRASTRMNIGVFVRYYVGVDYIMIYLCA